MATLAEALTIAIQHHQAGRLDAAEQIYRQILQADPNHADALHLLGVIACMAGNADVGIDYMRRAVQRNPDHADACSNLGVALTQQGNLDEAALYCRRALALKPDCAEAHNNLANALCGQGNLDEAIASYRRALALKPHYPEAHNNLGIAFRDQGNLDEAIACYRRALALKPDYAEAHSNLGNAHRDQGKLDEAVVCHGRSLHCKPDYAAAHYNLGVALGEQGKLDEAIACYRRALTLNPDFAEAHSNLGDALRKQGNLDEALAHFQRALSLKPAFADAHWNQSMVMLLTGDFEHGWPEYEWRWQTKLPQFRGRHFAQPPWDGQPLAGRTILLYAEQGLGDTLQFVRYAPLVQERGGRVLLECQPPLLTLLATCPGIDQIVAQGEPLPAFDVQAPLLSLPRLLGTTLNSIPARVPYLPADPGLTESWRKKLQSLDGFKVGIVWQGNPQFTDDHQRSIPLRYFKPLARVEGVRLVSLQKDPAVDQLHAAPFPVLDLGEQLHTFSDTAAVLKNLDLLVSSCTSVPHLAGALGMPVWLALPLIPDWRWLLGRDDSPWYPHHRLFRQGRPGDWSEVFERMATALSERRALCPPCATPR